MPVKEPKKPVGKVLLFIFLLFYFYVIFFSRQKRALNTANFKKMWLTNLCGK